MIGLQQLPVAGRPDEPAVLLELRVAHDRFHDFPRGHGDALAEGLLINQLLLHQRANRLLADANPGSLLRVLLAEELLVHGVHLAGRRLERVARNGDPVDPGGPGVVMPSSRGATAPGREGPPDEHEDDDDQEPFEVPETVTHLLQHRHCSSMRKPVSFADAHSLPVDVIGCKSLFLRNASPLLYLTRYPGAVCPGPGRPTP